MKNLVLSLALAVACLASSTSFGFVTDLTTEEKLRDFDQLTALVNNSYGPLHYKEQIGIIDYASTNAVFREKIRDSKSNSEFYYLLVEYVALYKDGHFNISLPTDYKKSLPIAVDLVQGKAIISDMKKDKLPESFDFEVGDEIVEINGVPVEQELDRIQKYISTGYELTARRIAAWSLFYQRASRFPVSEGEKVKIGIRRGTSALVDSVELEWEVSGSVFDEVDLSDGFSAFGLNLGFSTPDFGMLSNSEIATYRNPEFADRDFMCSGGTRIEKPADAVTIMDEPFVAYYYPTEKGNIGYLRIPHYSPEDRDLNFDQYTYAVRELEANTVGLIIDQDHNCGGSVRHLERLLGLFMNDEYEAMQFELRASKEEYLGFKSWMDESLKHTIYYQSGLTVLEAIKRNWENGNYLTEKMPIWGTTTGKYAPGQHAYTKPIIVLIDELSGSGGDAFPALMQGYGRAKLLGTRTSGLGGHVEIPGPLYYSRMNLRITKSLFYRPDGVAVENNGAVPDISYTHSRDDFMYGFRPYREFYTAEILKLIN